MSGWVLEAAARLSIPREEEFTLETLYYPRPVRWARCQGCGTTVWAMGRPNDAADAMTVHEAFCRG